jgi:uncharacterized protein YkwD
MKLNILIFTLLCFTIFGFAQQNISNINEQLIDGKNPNINKFAQSIFIELNISREKNNQAKFLYSKELENAALFHSEQMNEHKFFSHSNKFDKDYSTPLKRILKFNGNYPFIAENIANIPLLNSESGKRIDIKQSKDGVKYYNKGIEITNHSYNSFAKKVVKGWMNSEGHRKNILNPNLQETGIGVVFYTKGKGQYKQYYVLITQNLGGY